MSYPISRIPLRERLSVLKNLYHEQYIVFTNHVRHWKSLAVHFITIL